MTVIVTYTLQNTNSEYEVVDLGTPDPLTTLEGIYGNRDWSFDLVFSGSDDVSGNPILITGIVTTKPNYVLASNAGNTVTLSKAAGVLIFPGEQYRFVKFETQESFTYQDLSSIEEGLSVIGWDTPTQEEVTANYSFLISYTIPPSVTVEETTVALEQTFYWDFEPGWQNLQQLVSESDS
jgi:hypothetical protein